MLSPEFHRSTVLFALTATTAANAAFIAADPRLLHLEPWLSAVFLIGGAAYVAAIPLCLARRAEGFALAGALGVFGGAVAIADNLSLSGSAPNPATFALNVAVIALQIPLVIASLLWLRQATRAPVEGA